ncbi:suppressor of deletion of TFIIS [Friedmanniomyces endolithicus]|uniref:Suppressor of deletion of TFIIS n=1 Tax=Friedmanniomyces endolithicus TaxID=329885 RepID=A0AAN6J8D4_9PEZI|nr:suppressor of deletion of TFIIS [Friedmanniomyces endolithicus]KAK0292212.1 suppressor of deletion of TFIIS [Friedmanniomyces endolithicus]KAK0320206.1 suppressor of deletion of TFIIS [Friedmanniomyces endolithicus]KAK0986309.1 putative suppressor of disruption of TFIIS [Friedmanniomyces endolithicus]
MSDSRPVFFFDIDNCLYSKSPHVRETTQGLIDVFLQDNLLLDQEAAHKLHMQYHDEYSMVVEAIADKHGMSPFHFNSQVDDALPLEALLKPDPAVRKMLQDMDRSKIKLWLFTNAYITHGERVVRLLGLEDQFEGITYCNYGAKPLVYKPQPAMFRKAMEDARVEDVDMCYYVGSYPSIAARSARRYMYS